LRIRTLPGSFLRTRKKTDSREEPCKQIAAILFEPNRGISFANARSKIHGMSGGIGMAQKIATFDDWKDLFYTWQKDVGFDASLIKDYKFDAIYDDGTNPEIEFGEFKGRKKFSAAPYLLSRRH
jgi:hypothetical protein